MKSQSRDISFFPGCSLVTSAKENYSSLQSFCRILGYNLVEIEDWNCCGSSSAHCLNPELAFELSARDIALMASRSPVLIACPNCYKRLKQTFLHIKNDPDKRRSFEQRWQTPFDQDLRLMPFLEFLAEQDLTGFGADGSKGLNGLTFAPYYGCMLARPPIMRHEPNFNGLMENILRSLGAKPVPWRHLSQCCGTFLSISRPEIITPKVNSIIQGAIDVGADCIVTACSMCHLNLEVRCTLRQKIPIFHFSELLAVALGETGHIDWFKRHIIDPRPLFNSYAL